MQLTDAQCGSMKIHGRAYPSQEAMHIRRLLPSDAAAFQQVRLRALLDSPSAFGSSYEEEADRLISDVADSLAEGSGRTVFGAFDESTLLGVVGVGRERGLKERHRGFIRSMVVAPEARGRGVGKALMGVAIDFARSMPGLRQLTLAVTAENEVAVALYERLGFVVCGTSPEALHVEGRFYDELHMVCRLGDAPCSTDPAAAAGSASPVCSESTTAKHQA